MLTPIVIRHKRAGTTIAITFEGALMGTTAALEGVATADVGVPEMLEPTLLESEGRPKPQNIESVLPFRLGRSGSQALRN